MTERVRYRRRDRASELVALVATVIGLIIFLAGGWWLVNHRPAHDEPAAGEPRARVNDPVMIEVNGEAIHVSDFEAALATVPAQMREQLNTDYGRKEMAEELVKMKLLEQEARRRGIDDEPNVRGRIDMQRLNILANEALRQMMEGRPPITAQEAYERNKEKFETARVKAIVIPYQGSRAAPRKGEALPVEQARAKADQLVERLRKGEDFGAIARAESADTMGGELGQVSRGTMPPNIDQVLFSIPIGQISDAIFSPFGFHIFQVTERKARSFEELRPLLEQQAQALTADALVNDLRKNAKVEFKEPYFPRSRS